MNPVNIRQARASEAGQLTDIAIRSKQHWGYPNTWIDLWRQALTVTPEYIDQHHLFVAEQNEILGFYALVVEPHRELDHFWVRQEAMGRGIGRLLFQHAADSMRRIAPGATFAIEADPNAESFYLHMGARRVGEIQRNWDGLIRVLPLLEFTPAVTGTQPPQ